MKNAFLTVRDHHEYLPGAVTKVPDWSDVIRQIDYAMVNRSDLARRYKLAPERVLSGAADGGMVCEDSSQIKQHRNIEMRIIQNNPGYYITHTQLYVSLSSISKSFGKHNDTTDVWFWQCIGQTKWTVWDPDPITYILSPGDLIYVPVGMYHDPEPLTPRMGMSIGIKQ